MSGLVSKMKDCLDKKTAPILLFDPNNNFFKDFEPHLKEEGLNVICPKNYQEAIETLKSSNISIVIAVVGNDDSSAYTLLKESKKLKPETHRIYHSQNPSKTLPDHLLQEIHPSHFTHSQTDKKSLLNMLSEFCRLFLTCQERDLIKKLFGTSEKALKEAEGKLLNDKASGAKILKTLLIDKTPTLPAGISLNAMTYSSEELDGDFITFSTPSPHILDVALGDVMGKGLPSALIATSVKERISLLSSPFHRKVHLFDSEEFWHEDLPSVTEVIQELHRQMVDRLLSLDYYISLLYVRLNTLQRTFTFIDCGFTKPIYYRRSTRKAIPISESNFPLGTVQFHEYSSFEIHYEEGDFFVLASDGVTEAKSKSGELFGETRLLKAVEKYALLHTSELAEKLQEEVNLFTETDGIEDDFTLVILKVEELHAQQEAGKGVAKFNSALTQLDAVRKLTREICSKAPGNTKRLGAEMQLALDEIFTNIVIHGYKHQSGSPICIRAEYLKDQLMIEISDQALPFEPEGLPSVNLFGDREHGYGWYLIKHIVNNVVYTPKRTLNGWNHLRLYKNYYQEEASMELTTDFQKGVLIIHLNSETLDAKKVPDFKEQALRLIDERNPDNVIFDLSKLQFVDSSGLGAFLSLMRKLHSRGGHLSIAGMNKSVKTIFELVSMQKIFDCFETLEQATAKVGKQ